MYRRFIEETTDFKIQKLAVVNIPKEPQKEVSMFVIKIDEKYFRPCEVEFLLGDPTKAETELGWTREYDLDKLIDDMMN